MAQYLDNAGLQELVKKTKEFANNRVRDAVTASASNDGSKTITGWDNATSAAIYGDINITSAHVTDLADAMALKADLASPDFTGVPTAPTAAVGTNTTQIATTEFVTTAIGNIGEAMHYIGAINSEAGLRTSGEAGDTYKVATAGTYLGYKCEVGDMIIANKDYSSGLTSADVDVIQTNIDGAVTGPVGATSGHLAMFDNANGKVIADAGLSLSDLKTKQQAYSASADILENYISIVKSIEQDANGKIDVTFEALPQATDVQEGVVCINENIAEGDDSSVPTAYAVKEYVSTQINDYNTKLWTEGTYDHESLDDKFEAIETSAADLDAKIDEVSGAVATSAAALDAKITAVSGAVDNLIEGLDANVNSTGGVNVSANIVETDGKIVSLTFVDTTQTAITDAINALVVPAITSAASATITSISETNGKIAATYSPIAITSGQVTNLGQTLSDLIGGLDVAEKTIPTSGTITSISETDGKIAITSAPISISASQVNDLSAITTEAIDGLFA